MAKVEDETTIGRPVEVAFDFVADPPTSRCTTRTWCAEKDTGGPISKGTRFRASVRSAGRCRCRW